MSQIIDQDFQITVLRFDILFIMFIAFVILIFNYNVSLQIEVVFQMAYVSSCCSSSQSGLLPRS